MCFDDLFLCLGCKPYLNEELRRVFFFFTLQGLCLEQQFYFTQKFGFAAFRCGRFALQYGRGFHLWFVDWS